MILNQALVSVRIIPFSGRLDLESLSPPGLEAMASQERAVLVLDCTSIPHFTEDVLDEVLALRRHVERQRLGKLMIAVRLRGPGGQRITRLIPASLRTLMRVLSRDLFLQQPAPTPGTIPLTAFAVESRLNQLRTDGPA